MEGSHSVKIKAEVLEMAQAVKSATGASSISDVVESLLVNAYPNIDQIVSKQRQLIAELRDNGKE